MTQYIRKAIQQMTGYVPGEQPKKPGVVKLNTNENPYPPSPRVQAALERMQAECLQLYPDPLCSRLREALAKLHGCKPAAVFVGNGSDEILALCTRAFVEDNGRIGYFVPSYSLYPVLAAIRGVAQNPVELGPDFEWRMPSSSACSLFFLTNPNAPTGILYPRRLVRAFCERFRGVVVLDEAYADFARENCMELALKRKNVLVVRSLSKSYSLAGLRVGYAVGDPRLIEALFKVKDSYNVDAISQTLALAAVSDQEHMAANVRRIRATRRRLSRGLQAMGYVVYPSDTNFVWVKPPSIPARVVFEKLRRVDILVRYFPGPRTGDYLRITVGTDAATDALLFALKALHGEKGRRA